MEIERNGVKNDFMHFIKYNECIRRKKLVRVRIEAVTEHINEVQATPSNSVNLISKNMKQKYTNYCCIEKNEYRRSIS